MFKGRSKDVGKGRGAGAVKKVPLNGLFTDAVWHCNCAPRLPATRFQTKNGGKNHGRWFYTCQQAQPKRCNFFLWDDEAKSREAAAVLSNSRTEPQTPTKVSSVPGPNVLRTPYTDTSKRYRSPEVPTPYTPTKSSVAPQPSRDTQDTSTTFGTSDEEFYDWPASDDEDVLKVVEDASSARNMPPPETPRKALKIDPLSTPEKRRFLDMTNESEVTWPTLEVAENDVFSTPSTSLMTTGLFRRGQAMPSPAQTPTPSRFKDALTAGQDSELTVEVLRVLQDNKVPLNSDIRAELKGICDKHSLSTRGITKGRDVSRAMVNTKNEKISELQENIAALQAEREANKAVIRHLRRDMELMES
ncbi:MAG: hypothetical protein Q9166_008195 [cf. Caloplaca sp. 2 TL-2023]